MIAQIGGLHRCLFFDIFVFRFRSSSPLCGAHLPAGEFQLSGGHSGGALAQLLTEGEALDDGHPRVNLEEAARLIDVLAEHL